MKALHWLPVQCRIKFKLQITMRSVDNDTGQAYIKDLVRLIRETHGRAYLQSAAEGNYDIPRFISEFGRRAFSVAAPLEWNALPENIKTIVDKNKFKNVLKRHFL